MRMHLPAFLLVVCLAAPAASANAASITTLFASNNAGTVGGSVFFDIDIGPNDLLITGFDTNTIFEAFTIDFYTTSGTSVGNETNAGAWTMVASGSGTSAGLDIPTFITLDAPFLLSANTSYGFAIVNGPTGAHWYTNGTGANQFYSNGDLSLTLGTALNGSDLPFTGVVFDPRVWNGTIYYDVQSAPVPEPATILLLSTGLAVGVRSRVRNRHGRPRSG